MKNIKRFDEMFENFADETLNKINTEPNEPIVRDDLVGEFAPHRETPEINVEYAVEFIPSGTFKSFYNAENYLKELGYAIGSMQMNSPIGFIDSENFDYVSKWGNMNQEERKQLDGVIISTDFREGESIIVWYKSPKF